MVGLGDAGRVGNVVLAAVDRVVEARWDHAVELARATSGTTDERVQELADRFAREMGAVGAAAGAAAAFPGAGAVTFATTTAAELGWFTARAADLILTVAAVHGRTRSTVEERRAWILSVLAFGDGAVSGFTRLARELGVGEVRRGSSGTSIEALRGINGALLRNIVSRYGRKRGAVAVGRAIPLGIGAVIGGTANYRFARAVARQADDFFRRLPASLRVIDVEGRPR